MLDRLRVLWAERPAVVAAAVIAPIAFVLTLLVLFLVVGGEESDGAQQESVAQQAQVDQQAEQAQASASAQTTVVVVETKPAEGTEHSAAGQGQQDQSQDEAQTSDMQDGEAQAAQAQQQQASRQAQDELDQEQADEQPQPLVVAGRTVVPLDTVLEEGVNEAGFRHGSDGTEGGILPIANGVVVSSGPAYETTWELLIPSAGLKSTIVRVGHTPTGAMGSPDNPYVIGWLESSAAPGEAGNTLLAGHRDFEDISGNIGTGVCWELVNTTAGDQMIVRDNEQNIYYVYTVTEAVTVNPRDRDAAHYLWDTDEPVITLITCTGSFNADTHQYSHRFVVVGVLAAVASPDA